MRPRTSSAADAEFAIATDLLGSQAGPWRWANLGCWAGETDYGRACEALALRTGQAARLGPGQAVVDLACGHGASLALWPRVFGVGSVTALELRGDCVRAVRACPPPGLMAIHQASFDRLPTPLPAHGADAVVCVDAAYHARAMADFAALARHALRPGGRLAFTALVGTPGLADARGGQRWLLDRLLAAAHIPAGSVLTPPALAEVLHRHGFSPPGITVLNAEVLYGFATHVERRRTQLAWRARLRPDWWKIQATGWLCDYLYRGNYLAYVLVDAEAV